MGWQEGKRTTHWGCSVSFVTLSLHCSELVVALAAYSAFADLQLVTGVLGAFQLFKTKYCRSCCSAGKRGSHEKGMNVCLKLEKPPSAVLIMKLMQGIASISLVVSLLK